METVQLVQAFNNILRDFIVEIADMFPRGTPIDLLRNEFLKEMRVPDREKYFVQTFRKNMNKKEAVELIERLDKYDYTYFERLDFTLLLPKMNGLGLVQDQLRALWPKFSMDEKKATFDTIRSMITIVKKLDN